MITVIGGGPAGRYGAIKLASEGEEVILIEKRGPLGGQCLHQGCMVICALNDIAKHLDESRRFKELGIISGETSVSYPDAVSRMTEIHATISGILKKETENAGVEIRNAEAEVDCPEVYTGKETLYPDKMLISTGSKPFVPEIPGAELKGVYNPHTVIPGLKDIPERICIIGGGVIAAEYAYIFSSFGAEVDIIARSGFLKGMPLKGVESALKDLKGVKLTENATPAEITGDRRADGILLKDSGVHIETDAVLFATGLIPNSAMIHGPEKRENGAIITDEKMETSVKGVFAAGDVTGGPYLTPVARAEGSIAADAMLGRTPKKVPAILPQSVKLRYEHSFCSQKPDECMEMAMPAPSGPGSFWSVPERNTGQALIEYSKENGQICGMYLGTPASGPVSAYLAYMIENGVKTGDIAEIMEVHPSTDGILGLAAYAEYTRKKWKI
ncbi:FAD-dependent oxidoreductase [Methanoplanus limicola]|uniref:FAD-dependent pyridine nucleotide-disulfide oxidoreductase n=1 Tax=Methanoplanus limicola DSM 2279 TaxID=937775 RepID=H1YYX7_9EURY|nr:NAD(P)/FAD-dependent oxidoreductase [Methanoplanus limicola]EHQ37049.1 FAD-dependent pyridine nucleotide-disulfide oxidoreductase [Methanoplanus limicola DSM 2279]